MFRASARLPLHRLLLPHPLPGQRLPHAQGPLSQRTAGVWGRPAGVASHQPVLAASVRTRRREGWLHPRQPCRGPGRN